MPTKSMEYRQLLHRSVSEYIVVRWIICGVMLLSLFGVTFGIVPDALRQHLTDARTWLGGVALTLLIANVVFSIHQKGLTRHAHTGVIRNLIAQITIDLAVIAVVVHKTGTVGTVGAFLYLPHVVLSCLFFTRRTSLGILLASSGLYLGTIILENVGIMPFHRMFIPLASAPSASTQLLHAASVLILWGMIWTLVSQMSGSLHDCFTEIEESRHKTENTLYLCQEQMRYTAHQMKAPLIAVQSNLMLLQHEMGEDIPPRIKDILQRTDLRCETLNQQIYDILNLARLKSGEEVFTSSSHVSMAELLRECIDAHGCHVIDRGLDIKTELNDFTFYGNREALRMMLENLVSNAVNYSLDKGTVIVSINAENDPPGTIRVTDHGIGMTEKDKSKMFDDFFRSTKAKQHCRHSTGMGMAIVKQVTNMYGITIDVTSAPGEGTEITLNFPEQKTVSEADPASAAQTTPDSPAVDAARAADVAAQAAKMKDGFRAAKSTAPNNPKSSEKLEV